MKEMEETNKEDKAIKNNRKKIWRRQKRRTIRRRRRQKRKKWIQRRRKMLRGTAEVSNMGDNFFLLFIQIYSPFPFYYLASKKE